MFSKEMLIKIKTKGGDIMKLSKVFSIVTIAVMLLASVSNVVLATEIGGITINPNTNSTAAEKVGTIGGTILGIVQTVGTIGAVVVLIVLGIKYMMGSAEEKAEYKKTLTPYIIGAIFVLLASNIVKWLFDAVENVF